MSKSTSQESNKELRDIYRKGRVLTMPDIDVEKMGLTDLLEERLELQKDLDEIKSQLSKAKTRAWETGEYSDSDWFRKAEAAKRYKGRLIQQIQLQITALKKKNHEERHNNPKESKKFIHAGEDAGLTKEDWDGFHNVLRYLNREAQRKGRG